MYIALDGLYVICLARRTCHHPVSRFTAMPPAKRNARIACRGMTVSPQRLYADCTRLNHHPHQISCCWCSAALRGAWQVSKQAVCM